MSNKLIKVTNVTTKNGEETTQKVLIGSEHIICIVPAARQTVLIKTRIDSRHAMSISHFVTETIEQIEKLLSK